ncbi:hypothetical protein [Brassicibacter mesophilus]|uniref:hypothetical protein n=1 Tax=Brassicibacter mesophilus TaxID=745119 RepID=UPI003D1C1B20
MDICMTLILKAENGYQVTYQLVYQPCPIWSINDEWIINLNPESPYYKEGNFQKLLDYHNNEVVGRTLDEDKECILILSKETFEHGVEEVRKVKKDIENTGFKVKLLYF